METEKSNIDKQYDVAMKKFRSSNLSTRIASFDELRQLAEKRSDDSKKMIFNTLCDYLRDICNKSYAKSKMPAKEYQTLLDVLFKSSGISIFGKFKAELHKVRLTRTDLEGAHFKNANLSNARFSLANLSNTNLLHANLSGAILLETNLSKADLLHANLSDAKLLEANLWEANLSGANLSGANLSDTILSDADFSDAILQGAQLQGANLMEIRSIERANFCGAKIGDRAIMKKDLPPQYEKVEYYAEWNPPPKKEED